MTLAQTHTPPSELLRICRSYADAHANPLGVAKTPIPGLSIVRIMTPGEIQSAIYKPLIAMLVQGKKRVSTGTESFEYAPGEAMVVSTDTPTTSVVTQASPAAPYYALILEFDPVILRDLMNDMDPREVNAGPVRIDPIDETVADTALRLARLLEQPEALPILGSGLLRELHYWLLAGRHGDAIRRIGMVDSHAERIGRAIALLRRDFAKTIRVETLAREAVMSEPAFHQHFRAITTLTPLQFQKQLRLIEARRMMLANGAEISKAAFDVGYRSIPQFTREYARLFGAPPGRDRQQAKEIA